MRQLAPHVRNAIQMTPQPGNSPDTGPGQPPAASDYVLFEEKKLGGAPPPPPRSPVYTLQCDDKGQGCSLRDITTGRMQPAQNLYAGFIRMGKGSNLYLSPRPGAGLQGDSHPTIAARTPEWQRGQRAVVAGGEVGIIGGKIIGHNDKTGHFQSRKNLRQSGMPSDLFHPFTEDPNEWYRPPE